MSSGGGELVGISELFESTSDPCELAGRAEPCLACLGYCTGELHDPRWFKERHR